jgi:hypothetical protein
MKRLAIIIPALTAVALCTGMALAQTPPATPATPPAATAPAQPSGTTEDVKKWSLKQWNKATKEWAKDKAKWADCRAQAKTQKLSGRKSWSFLYSCMSTKA